MAQSRPPATRTSPDDTGFALPAELTITEVETLHRALMTRLEQQGGPLLLDAKALSSITTPGLQLLVALARSQPPGEVAFAADPSPALAAATEAGLAAHLPPLAPEPATRRNRHG